MKKPDLRRETFDRSYAELGVIAQRDRLIELRAPDPDGHSPTRPRIYLTPHAAVKLRDWLDGAIEMQQAETETEQS